MILDKEQFKKALEVFPKEQRETYISCLTGENVFEYYFTFDFKDRYTDKRFCLLLGSDSTREADVLKIAKHCVSIIFNLPDKSYLDVFVFGDRRLVLYHEMQQILSFCHRYGYGART